MRSMLVLSGILFVSNALGAHHETAEALKKDHVSCIAALSLARDKAEADGEVSKLRHLTAVQNNVYLDLPKGPKYSLVRERKRELIKTWNEVAAQCEKLWASKD